ncbi:MAG TPA: HAD family hydrolase, partial [Candidatus Binataceae bacterium]|nr:HAD family hydrolase [Candidatus Binataceae bacterium]
SILSFVKQVSDKSNSTYVKPEDRVATFDQDGTLWTEHPIYTQAAFALDRVRVLAPNHPEWKQHEPFKSVLTGDRAAMSKFTEADWEMIVAVTHAGMTTQTFLALVNQWLATAKDPRFHRHYSELVYQPMLEVMNYLREKGFKVYIVTGGGQEFVRAYSQNVYGIEPEEIVGSSIQTTYEYDGRKPVLMREPKVFFIDDHAGKPVGINLFIGKQPVAAFGNSTGDQQMLEWTQNGDGPRLMMLVLHDDGNREYAYGPTHGLPDTKVGTFTPQLYEEAKARHWTVISMKNDWKRIFAFTD